MDACLARELELTSPTAIEIPDLEDEAERRSRHTPSVTWGLSGVNPKNLIDGSELEQPSPWRIDGGADGIRFFAIPDFARGQPPYKIDVYVPEFQSSSHTLWQSLGLESLLTSSSEKVASCTAARYLVRILGCWSGRFEEFEDAYKSLPYGSRIVVENVCATVSDVRVHFIPDYSTERLWMSTRDLRGMWHLTEDSWPRTIDWHHLRLIKQPHEAISLVHLRDTDEPAEMMVFKSVLSDLQHFYHELKLLLTIPPHPNIISRPRYIVTKRGRFGSKMGVCGFILDYHQGGTLQDVLDRRSRTGNPCLRHILIWAKQLTSALIHIRNSVGFYANLKLINIVMTSRRDCARPVLIDFEQRSGWFSWSAPEVHYVHYLEVLASHSRVPATKQYYTAVLRRYISDWRPLDIRARYCNPVDGFSAPWSVLDNREKESAQVFMLGKLLWCMFEAATSVSSCLTPETLREPPCDLLFPTFERTPEFLRGCIQQCTSGAPEWGGQLPRIIRRGRRLYRSDTINARVDLSEVQKVDVQKAGKSWWREQIATAERFVEARSRNADDGLPQLEDLKITDFMRNRPSLAHVLQTLETVESQLS